MSRWHRENPEYYEMYGEPWDDWRAAADMKRKEAKENPDQISNAPCRVCGEVTTKGGQPCRRCSASLDDERSRHIPGKD